MRTKRTIVRESTATVPTRDRDAWIDALESAGMAATDLGQRVTTEEGVDAEAVLAVALRVPRRREERAVTA